MTRIGLCLNPVQFSQAAMWYWSVRPQNSDITKSEILWEFFPLDSHRPIGYVIVTQKATRPVCGSPDPWTTSRVSQGKELQHVTPTSSLMLLTVTQKAEEGIACHYSAVLWDDACPWHFGWTKANLRLVQGPPRDTSSGTVRTRLSLTTSPCLAVASAISSSGENTERVEPR